MENNTDTICGQREHEARGTPSIVASRCRRCQHAFFPPRMICPNCFTDDTLEEIKLGGRGTIYSFSVVRVPPPSGRPVPYAAGYVDLQGEALRIFTVFEGCEPEDINVGMEVEMVQSPKYNGPDNDEGGGYAFRPVKKRILHCEASGQGGQ